jgi:ribosome-associated protein
VLRVRQSDRTDAIERLVTMIRASLVEPKPRRPTKPTRASKERRLAGKARQSCIEKPRREGLTDS